MPIILSIYIPTDTKDATLLKCLSRITNQHCKQVCCSWTAVQAWPNTQTILMEMHN